jgi:hypothetical protein
MRVRAGRLLAVFHIATKGREFDEKEAREDDDDTAMDARRTSRALVKNHRNMKQLLLSDSNQVN